MSSEEYSTSLPHTRIWEWHVRKHCTPKHLEDHILALSFHPRQRRGWGAAASADSWQTDADFHLASGILPNSSAGDPLSTTTLKKITEFISILEEGKGRNSQNHQQIPWVWCLHWALLDHITLFPREEEEKAGKHSVNSATHSHIQSPLHFPSCVKQVYNMESLTERHIPTNLISTSQGEAEIGDYICTFCPSKAAIFHQINHLLWYGEPYQRRWFEIQAPYSPSLPPDTSLGYNTVILQTHISQTTSDPPPILLRLNLWSAIYPGRVASHSVTVPIRSNYSSTQPCYKATHYIWCA